MPPNVHGPDEAGAAGPADRPEDPIRAIERLAAAGEFDAVMDFINGEQSRAYSIAQLDTLVRTVIRQLSRRSPAELTDKAFAGTLEFLLYLAMRLQCCADRRMAIAEEQGATLAGQMTAELDRVHLAAIERISRLLGELSLNWASTKRRWKLAQDDPPRSRGACQCPADQPWPEIGTCSGGPGRQRRNSQRPR